MWALFCAALLLCGTASAQSAEYMADFIESKIHTSGVSGNCAACSAVVESLYKVIARGEGHHINDAGTMLPQILELASKGFAYDAANDRWDRLAEPGTADETHMLYYIHEHLVKSHHMMVILSPYYLQNERHSLHQILCVDLLRHCEDGFIVAAHHEDIHDDYDLQQYQEKYAEYLSNGDL